MSDGISISVDISEVQAALSATAKSLKSISRQTMGIAARTTVKALKTAIRQTTKRQTGELSRAYRYKVKKDGSSASVFPRTASGNHLVLAKIATLSYGNDISVRPGRTWLSVKGRGYFARPRTVHIPARNFVRQGESFAENGGYMDEVQKMIDRELAKFWGE